MKNEGATVRSKFDELIKFHQSIIDFEKNNKPEAHNEFKKYLSKVEEISSYNIEPWPISRTKQVWAFASNLRSQIGNDKIAFYLKEVRTKIIALEKDGKNTESLELIECELIWDVDKVISKEIPSEFNELSKKLYEKYPYNPEFKHSYAHALVNEGSIASLEFAKKLYRECLEIWGEESSIHSAGNCEYKLAKKYCANREYKKAFDVIKEAKKYKFYDPFKSSRQQQSVALDLYSKFISFKDYVDETKESHVLLDKTRAKIELIKNEEQKRRGDFELEIKSHIEKSLAESKKSSLEMLSIFSAIIAFIISAVMTAIAKPSLEFAAPLLAVVGASLILFVLAISVIHSPQFYGKKFNVPLVVLALMLLLWPLFYNHPTKQDSSEINIEINSGNTNDLMPQEVIPKKVISKKRDYKEVNNPSESNPTHSKP